MRLGNFSVSLAVKGIAKSRVLYGKHNSSGRPASRSWYASSRG